MSEEIASFSSDLLKKIREDETSLGEAAEALRRSTRSAAVALEGRVARSLAELREAEAANEAQIAQLSSLLGRVDASLGTAPRDIVHLDVGGRRFSTSRSTLLATEAGSFFCAMFGSSSFARNLPDDHVYFIDRNPEQFEHVLEYMRSGVVFVERSEVALRKLALEAEFFQLDGLSALLANTLAQVCGAVSANRLADGTGPVRLATLSDASTPSASGDPVLTRSHSSAHSMRTTSRPETLSSGGSRIRRLSFGHSSHSGRGDESDVAAVVALGGGGGAVSRTALGTVRSLRDLDWTSTGTIEEEGGSAVPLSPVSTRVAQAAAAAIAARDAAASAPPRFSADLHGPNMCLSRDGRTIANAANTYEVAVAEGAAHGPCVWRVKVNGCSYMGLGLVPSTLTERGREFHNKPSCWTCYWNGAAWSNGSQDEPTEGWEHGDVVTVAYDPTSHRFVVLRNDKVIRRVDGVLPEAGSYLRLGVILRSWSSLTLLSPKASDFEALMLDPATPRA
uniref:BTB domain-containing protein n=1 Tax=Sexangularia sp. CB-2014 TaxID=1486929 RepID=A0A6U0IW13_9EUKA